MMKFKFSKLMLIFFIILLVAVSAIFVKNFSLREDKQTKNDIHTNNKEQSEQNKSLNKSEKNISPEDKSKPNKDDYIVASKNDVYQITQSKFEELLPFYGDVVPKLSTFISSETFGRIDKILVHEGQMVKKNQIIAILSQDTILQQIKQQRAILKSLEAKVQFAKNELNAKLELFNKGFISKFAFDQVDLTYNIAKNELDSQRAAFSQLEIQKSHTTIRSAVSGVIYKQFAEIGEIISSGQALFSIADVESLQIKLSLDISLADKVAIGSIAKISTQDINGSVQLTSIGKVAKINQIAQNTNRSSVVYITVDGKNHNLISGQAVSGVIVLSTTPNVMQVNKNTLWNDNMKNSYLLIESNGIAKKILIDIVGHNTITNEIGFNIKNDQIKNDINNLINNQHKVFAFTNNLINLDDGKKVKIS